MIQWHDAPYSVTLDYDHHDTQRTYYRYTFTHDGQLIFTGNTYSPSPLSKTDLDIVFGLLGFLSAQPGDTDPDYFQDYTPEQLAWCKTHAEQLSILVSTYEES